MDAEKLQDLIMAAGDVGTWDLKDTRNQAMVRKLVPKLVEALTEVALEVVCPECGGRGFITGATGGPVQTRGNCPKCKGLRSKYFFLAVL